MRLALRGLWWRRGTSCVVLFVIALSIAGAVTGPLFSRAAAESALRIRLEQAPVGDSGIRLATSPPTVPTLQGLAGLFPKELLPYFPRQVPSLQVHTGVATSHGGSGVSDLTWRRGFCDHLVLVSGHCPRGPSEAIVSDRTVANAGYHLKLGSTFFAGGAHPLTVVGVYRPGNLSDSFWFGHNYFNAQFGNDDQPDQLDSIFVDQPVITHMHNQPSANAFVDFYLAPDRIRLDDVNALDLETSALLQQYGTLEQPGAQSLLPQILKSAAHDRDVLNEGSLTVTAMLVLLSWLVLHRIISGTSEARAGEVAAAKLRGWGPGAVVRFGLAETAVLLAAGVPLGMFLGYLSARLLAATTLASGTPVLVRAAPGVAAAIATSGAAIAAVAASRQVLRRPIIVQWRKADSQLVASGPLGLIRDIVIGLIACGGLVLLRRTGALSGGRPQILGLFAPGLFILAVARLGTRAVPVFGRRAARDSRASPKVARFLAVRQVARRRSALGASALLAAAIGLAVYSVASISIIHTNQQARAEAEVGAAQVVDVQPRPGTTLVDAVDRADPTGRWAMAVARWQPVGGNLVGQVYAVQSSRLAHVAFWRDAWGAANIESIRRALEPAGAPSVVVRGDALRVRLSASGPHLGSPPARLALALMDRYGRRVLTVGPSIRPGNHTYTLPARCSSPCRLSDLEVYRSIDDHKTMKGTVVVHEIAQRLNGGWRSVAANLTSPGAWRAGPMLTAGFVLAEASTGGLTATFSVEAGGWPTLEVADYPRPLPIVEAARAQSTSGRPYVGEIAQIAPLAPAADVRVLPRGLQYGALTDLDASAKQLPEFDTASDEVWLSSSAPRDALARLRAAGLSTGDPDTLAAHLRVLRSEGPAQTLNLLTFASVIATLFAIAAIALNIAITARRRAYELAALGTVGIRRRTLRRASVIEQLLLLAISVVLGTAAALIAFGVGASSVPQFSERTAVPLSFTADPLAVAGLLGAIVVLVGAGAVLAGRLLLASAVPTLLRESAQ